MSAVLADTSAWHRSSLLGERWKLMLDARVLHVCAPVALELLYSARGKADYAALAASLELVPTLPLDQRAARAALNAQALLAERSQHRGPAPADLLIAAIAEVNGATLLHYDRHFDAIAHVTGQPMEWLAPQGSLN